jgi:ABC-type glycerol-3-phosphate transport system permease component
MRWIWGFRYSCNIHAFSEAWANFIWPFMVVTTKEKDTTELGLTVYQRHEGIMNESI